MSNFKSGSGDLDFGDDNEGGENAKAPTEDPDTQAKGPERTNSPPTEQTTSVADESVSDTERSSGQSTSTQVTPRESAVSHAQADEYPYFVRRSNVGDERETRLEIHVRDKVANQEADFRNQLAEMLGVTEIAKTDAREFALLAAFRHPQRVAELMEEEGFGTLD